LTTTLGGLIAMYEHKIFVQARILTIKLHNSNQCYISSHTIDYLTNCKHNNPCLTITLGRPHRNVRAHDLCAGVDINHKTT